MSSSKTRLFKVLYDFQAKEEGEMSVVAGEVVRAQLSDLEDNDGWILVESVSAPFTKGFIPEDYVTAAEHASQSPAPTPTSMASNSTAPRRPATGQPITYRSIQSPVHPPRDNNQMVPHTAPAASGGNKMAFVGDFAHMFSRHDKCFHQVMEQREDQHDDLQRAMDHLNGTLREAQTKGADVLTKIGKLDELVESERRQWNDRVNEEKMATTRQIEQRYGMA